MAENPYLNIPRPALYVIERIFREEINTWGRMAEVYRDELIDENNEKLCRENSDFFREQLDLVESILSGN